jgi:beta-lactamase regulating signal transducer with metallopeptidase domain
MQPYSLHLAGVLLTFILKVTAAFVLCLVLARLLPSPRHRFLTWLGFLLGAGVSWAALLTDEAVSVLSAAGRGAIFSAAAATEPGEHVTVPVSWGLWIARIVVLLGAIYLAGMLALLAKEAYKHLRLRTWLHQARQPSPELRQIFQRLCSEFNIHRCDLLILPKVKSPATVYWWTPRVILPELCEKLVTSPQLENILRHELIHTLRCDYLWATLGDLLCALLFFHPAVWEARKRLSVQRELACDLGVVEVQPAHRADYADSLAGFVRLLMLQQTRSLGVDFAGQPSLLGTRIRCILTEPEQVPGWKRAAADVFFVLFVVIFGSISPSLTVSFAFSQEPESISGQFGPVTPYESSPQGGSVLQSIGTRAAADATDWDRTGWAGSLPDASREASASVVLLSGAPHNAIMLHNKRNKQHYHDR